MLNNYDINAGFEPIGKKIWAWNDYWNAVFFAWSLLTTIGYGNLSCHTMGGRIATIIYASTGIPIFLIALNALGKMLFLSLQHIWEQFRAKLRRKTKYLQKKIFLRRVEKMDYGASQEDFLNKTKQDLEEIEVNEKEESSDVEFDIFQTFPMHMALVIVLVYIALNVNVKGLGDEVPRHPHYACAFFIFFVVGLALVSMCITIVQMRIENQYMAALQLIDEEARNNYGSTIQIGEPETISSELQETVETPLSLKANRPLTIIGAGNPGVKWRRPMMNFQLHATTEDPRQHSQESDTAHTPNSFDSDVNRTNMYRMPSTSTLSGTGSTVISTPPVLNALISRQRSTKRYKQRPIMREDSIRSNYHERFDDTETTPLTERQWNSPVVQFEHFRPPGSPPMQPQPQQQQPIPARNSVFNAPLSVITEANEEEIRESLSQRNSSKKSHSLLQQAAKNSAEPDRIEKI
uniref:Potassium channel domain-containing protein n=1 Tax=Panagrolaimus sp. ES5 TaxID=591445 RepID=A0AC34FAE7_9BILA